MIGKDEMMGVLVEACPSFAPHWRAFLDEWQDDSDPPLYIALGNLARHLIGMLERGETTTFPAVFATVERLHREGDPFVKEAAAVGLLEDLQNVNLHRSTHPEQFREFLGPWSRRWWGKLYRFWEHGELLRDTTKPVLELDGRNFSTLEEFYAEVSRVLIPGARWGRNLDAFDDILRGGFGTPPGGFVIRWKYSELSRERLGYPETVRQLEWRLVECHPSNRWFVASELQNARNNIGPTVFDWLIEIIHDHGPGGREAWQGVELILD